MKVSIIVPVYYNEKNLVPLYNDIKEKVIDVIDYDYEIVMVDDGSKDNSYKVMQELASKDSHIKIIKLSRNFGSHSAVLAGLNYCTGDCAVFKAADLQEPTELILDMVNKWKEGNNVVLAVREGREESIDKVFFANFYYSLVRLSALKTMPKHGFDVYLIDRKVIDVLITLDENNSALTGQILWSGFKTAEVPYTRLARQIGKSRYTLKKKIKLVKDTLFNFSRVPIKFASITGFISFLGAFIWAVVVLIQKCLGKINIQGWALLFIFQLFSFGIIMLTLGLLGEYIWRNFDSSRNRPNFIVEDKNF